MPTVVLPSRNVELNFPDSMSKADIEAKIKERYPTTGEDVANYVEGVKNAAMEGQDLIDPFQQMSNDNYVLFKQFQADKKTSAGEFFGIAKDTFNQVRDELATGIGTAAYKTYQGEGVEVAKSLGEGMTAGMVGTYDILNKIFDPAQPIPRKEDFVGKVAKPNYTSNAFMGMGGMIPNAVGQDRVNTEEDYNNLIASEKQRDSEIVNRLYAMESTMRNASIPEVARGGQFADPFLAAGLGGALVKVALKGGKTLVTRAAAKAAAQSAVRAAGTEGVETAAEATARTAAQGVDNIPSTYTGPEVNMRDFVPDPNAPIAAFASTAPSPMAQAGLRAAESTAGAIQGVASLPSRALQGVGRIAESVAPGSGVGAQATALTASAMGDLGLTAGVVGGAKATEKIAEVAGAAARIAKQEASRAGLLEQVALDTTVSPVGRKFAAGMAQLQPVGRAVLDITKGAVKGAAAGSVVGGALGGLAERNLEGVAAGFGAGGALGGITGAFHGAFELGKEAVGGSTSRTRQQATGDLNTFITTRPEIEQAAWSDTMSKLVAKIGPERAASQLDSMRVAEASGGKIRVATLDEIKQGLAPGWVNIDGMEIVLNPEKIRGDTAAHESAHVLFNSVINRAFRPEIETAIFGLADPVTGQIVKPGVFDDIALGKVAEQIRDAYGKNTIAANEFRGFANTLKNSTDADSLANARSRIADEMTAAYTGRLFERTRAGRFNPDRLPLVYRKVLSAIEDGVLDKFRSVMFEKGMDLGFDNVAKTFKDKNGKPIRIPELDAIVKKAYAQKLKTVDVTNAKPDLIPVNPADRALWAKTYGGARGVLNDNGTPKSQSQIDAEAAARWQDMTSRLSALPDSEKIGIDFSRDKAGKTVMTAKGQLSPTALTAILDSGALDPSAKAVLVEVLNSMQRADKSTFDTRYYGVYTRGKGGNKMVAGVKSASQNEILPYSVEINSKDGVLIRAVDVSKVRDRLATAMTKPEFKAAFDSPAEALKGFRKYMDNITQINAIDSATLLGGGIKGATRRNLFYDALGFRLRNNETLLNAPQSVVNKSQNTIKSYRAERFAKLVDSGNKFAFEEATTYERGMRNFQPDAFTPETLPNGESFTNPDGFRILNKTGSKLFRTYDDTGKLIGVAESKEKAVKKAMDEATKRMTKEQPANIRFQFAGEAAEMPKFMRDSLESAKAMAKEGKDNETIRAITGWFPGKYDDKMRWEIPDEKAKLDRNITKEFATRERSSVKLGNWLEHNDLFSAYPDAVDIIVEYNESLGSGGAFQEDTIYFGPDTTDIKSILLHEIQHWIQDKEGFAKGGDSRMAFADPRMGIGSKEGLRAAQKILKRILGEMRTPLSIEAFAEQAWQSKIINSEIESSYNDYLASVKKASSGSNLKRLAQESASKEWYRNLAGEIESRDIQARQSFTSEQRKAIAPYSSENIAKDEAIVLKNADKAESSIRFQPVTPEQDAAYLQAVKSGDGETAQRLVDEVAKGAGYNVEGYHGTKDRVVEFIRDKIKSRFPYSFGFHFTSRESEALIYASDIERFHNADRKGQKPLLVGGENVIHARLKYKNPLILDTGTHFTASSRADLDRYEIMGKLKAAIDAGEPYDAVVIERRKGDEWDGNNVIVFNPSQIKSADPITYDNAGNVIPLSERFNPKSNDIRFQPGLPGDIPQQGLENHPLKPILGNAFTFNPKKINEKYIKQANESAERLGGGSAFNPSRKSGDDGQAKLQLDGIRSSEVRTVEEINRRILEESPSGKTLAGGEHFTFIPDNKDYVIKTTKVKTGGNSGFTIDEQVGKDFSTSQFRFLGFRHASVSEYVARTAEFSKEFNIPWQVVEIAQDINGDPVIYSKMKKIEGTPLKDSSPEDKKAVKKLMTSKGFEYLGDSYLTFKKGYERLEGISYFNPKTGVLISDVEPRNFVRTKSGKIEPVDLMINKFPLEYNIKFQPDPASPNILNGSDGSRIIKSTSGKYRVYLATGALAGVKETLESAQKLIERLSNK